MIFERKRYRIAIDTGGTFVDAVEFDEETGRFRIAKARTTPSDPSEGVVNALKTLDTPLDETYMIIHGTTLGVNAIIQRRGAKTGIITNEGFRDIFEIGRGDVPPKYMYDFNYDKPKPLVRRRHVRGVPCRINYKGEVIKELDEEALRAAAAQLVGLENVESIAIVFLHSYKNPIHEVRAAQIISSIYPDISISISSEVVREYREYERMSTTVLDAYLKPVISRYLSKLEKALYDRGFRGVLLIMRSDGGVMTVSAAAKTPIHTVQSGPAGGVVGATYYSRHLGKDKIISMDIGGTSLDVCVINEGAANIIHQTTIEHYPLLITTYDVRSVGAGGGSIATARSGILNVGPESAGAEPGPMCYGRGGTLPTVTDAAVCLGYIDPEAFLSGVIPLRKDLAEHGIRENIARPLGIDIETAAAGILKVTLANSIGAIRQITVEEGLDPAEFSLLAFGGAGPMLAPILAREMKIPEVIVPVAPAAFSAWGMLMSDIRYEASQTHITLLNSETIPEIEKQFLVLERKVKSALVEQKAPYIDITINRSLELRYLGQEHTLEVQLNGPLTAEIVKESFQALHLKKYGHKMDNPVELVNLRVRGLGLLRKPRLQAMQQLSTSGAAGKIAERLAYCLISDKMTKFDIYRRDKLHPGDRLDGPAIVEEGTSTTVIHTGQSLKIDMWGNMIIQT
jgi:N-methylhydantoinase A